MSNLIFGILTVILCSFGFYQSWRFTTKNNYKAALLLLLLCGLLLRIYTATDFYLHTWDERYHALVAKNLMEHPLKPTLYDDPVLQYDYKNWPANHVWLHKQPMALWAMSASMSVFGVNVLALRLPSVLLSTLAIGLTFFIGRFFFNKRIAYLAAFFFSINGLILELTGGRVATDHIDVFFLFFIELAIFFSIRYVQKEKVGYNILAGVALGAAILSKWLPALIVLPVWLLIMYDSGKFRIGAIIRQFVLLCMVCTVIFLPWQIYIFEVFPQEAAWESLYNLKHLTEGLEGRTGPWYYFINKIRINYGELIYLPLLWFLWKTCKEWRNYKRLAISIWFMIPLVFFSFAQTKMQGYLLFSAPALFLMTSEFYFVVRDYSRTLRYKWFRNILLFLLIALPVRYSIERMKPFEVRERKPQWVVDLEKLNEAGIERGILFNYDRPIEAMFYTNLTVYPEIPSPEKLRLLIDDGYTILIADDTDDKEVAQELKRIEGVRMWDGGGLDLKP